MSLLFWQCGPSEHMGKLAHGEVAYWYPRYKSVAEAGIKVRILELMSSSLLDPQIQCVQFAVLKSEF